MRSNALKKEEYFEETAPKPTGSASPKPVAMKIESAHVSWETWRVSIAQASQAACNLEGNVNCPDFEEFLFKGGKPVHSDFA